MLPRQDVRFIRGDSPISTPPPVKRNNTIRSRLISLREHQKDQKDCYSNLVMNELTEDVSERNNSAITVEVLKKELRLKLLKPLRLLRTPSFRYINIEAEDIAKAYFIHDIEKNYALLWAAFIGNIQFLDKLYSLGADVNFVHPGDNFNALHLSALNGSVECTHWLLGKGCTIITTVDGYSPLHYAVLGNSQRICRYLIEGGCRIDATTLHAAVHANSIDCVQYLLGLQVPVNGLDSSGQTPLHIAADIGNLRILNELLTDQRIQINAKTKVEKYTALHLAAENGYTDCLQVLLKNGANVDALSEKKQTPLYLACKMAHLDCVEILLKHEAAVNIQDTDRRTPLHAAVSKSPNSLQIVQRLVDRKADVHLADDFGYTVLHIAALNELDECVEYLIMNGANVAAKTDGHMTALNIINRKTPLAVDKIPKRLNLSLAYNQEQSLKFSFRDIIRNSLCGEIGYLYTLQREGQAKVLEHPLCEAFLHLKWQKVRFFILLRAAIALVAVTLLSMYVLWGITKNCYNVAHHGDLNATETCVNKSFVGKILSTHPFIMTFSLNFVILLLFINIVRIIFSFAAYKSAKHFLSKQFNILELFITVSVFSLKIHCEDNRTCWWHKPIGGLTVLFSWVYLMIIVGQLPSIGTYVAMFNKVLKEFLKMVMAFFCLLLGFTFTFCVLKHDAFKNPAEGFTKVMGMMTGELNVNDIVSDEEHVDPDDDNLRPYEAGRIATVFVLSLFIVFVTIVLMNLLIGIAVNDVEGLRKTADLCKLIQQTKLIYFLERACFKGYFPPKVTNILKQFLYKWPNSYTVVMYVRPLSPHEKRLPRDVMEAGLKIALDRSKARYNKNNEKPSAEQRIHSLENQIVKLQNLVGELNDTVRSLTRTASPGLTTIDEVPDCDTESLQNSCNQLS